MYGSHINTLNLYLKTNGRLPTLAWYHTGALSDKWYMAQVDITSIHTFQLMFEGIRGNSYRGDIALDDIMYSYSPCPQTSKFNCSFSICFNSLFSYMGSST